MSVVSYNYVWIRLKDGSSIGFSIIFKTRKHVTNAF